MCNKRKGKRIISRCGDVRRHYFSRDTKSTQQGFTLVELIVGLMLAVLVISAAGSFLIFGTNLLSNTTERSQQQIDVTNVATQIAEELRLASSVQLVTGQPLPTELSADQRVLYIGNADGALATTGYFYLQYGSQDANPRNYFGADWYGSYGVTLDYAVTVQEDRPKTFQVTVSAFSLAGELTNTASTRTFELVNSPGSEQPFASAQAQSATTPFYLLYTYWEEDATTAFADGDIPGHLDGVPWNVPVSGNYKLECWGADGGVIPVPPLVSGSQNGVGGYSSGEVYLARGTTVYLTPGGAGMSIQPGPSVPKWVGFNYCQINGGSNGGGDAGQDTTASPTNWRSSGGGGSDIRVLANSLYNRILVSGGGGGNSSHAAACVGGNGGGEIGGNGGSSATSALARGGTQNAGGSSQSYEPIFALAGFGQGGSCRGNSAAGGGGGWYGGGTGNGSGGGSGYTLTLTSVKPTGYFSQYASFYLDNPINVQATSVQYVNKPTDGNAGYVRITFISRTQ